MNACSFFNLYVTEKYQVVGFDYELDGFREMYFYKYKDMYDVNVNLNKKGLILWICIYLMKYWTILI